MQYRFTFVLCGEELLGERQLTGLPTRQEGAGGLAEVGESGKQSGTSEEAGENGQELWLENGEVLSGKVRNTDGM